MSGILTLWALGLLVAWPARQHLRRAILALGRGLDGALLLVSARLHRAWLRARRRERRRVLDDPRRGRRAHARLWLAALALALTALASLLFAAAFADRALALVLLGFTALAGAQLSCDLGLLARPARLARARPRAQRAFTALAAVLLVSVAVGRAALVNAEGLGPALTALLLPLPAAALVVSLAVLVDGARVLAPRAAAHLLGALAFTAALVRAPVRPLTAAADALLRAFVAPADAVMRRTETRAATLRGRPLDVATLKLEQTSERA